MKNRKFIIISLVLLALMAGALLGGSTLVLRLLFLAVLVLIVSYLWAIFGVRGISLQAEPPPEYCQVGKRFLQEMTVTNDSHFPKLWLRIEEGSDMPGRREAMVLNLPSGGGSYRWQSGFYCQRRGRYDIGKVIATATDPFGLFSRKRTMGEAQGVLVYPATFDLPLFKSASFDEFGRSSGYQSISQISTDASSVREFYSGDSLNHIHWPSMAHTGRLMVKMFDADHSSNTAKTVWLVLDMQKEPHVGEGDESTEEYAVTIAASLVKKHIDAGMRVGLLTSGDRFYFLPPEGGEDHLWRTMESLAVVRATGTTPVNSLVAEHIEYFRGDSVVIIITPSVNSELYEAARQLKGRVDAIVAVLLDASSFGGNAGTITIARNLSTGGVQVYAVKQGDELAAALDHRVSLLHARYI